MLIGCGSSRSRAAAVCTPGWICCLMRWTAFRRRRDDQRGFQPGDAGGVGRGGRRLLLSVGSGEVTVDTASESVTGRKVLLPARWLKGFGEVQALARGKGLAGEVTGVEALRFVPSLPRSARRPLWARPGRAHVSAGAGRLARRGVHRGSAPAGRARIADTVREPAARVRSCHCIRGAGSGERVGARPRNGPPHAEAGPGEVARFLRRGRS